MQWKIDYRNYKIKNDIEEYMSTEEKVEYNKNNFLKWLKRHDYNKYKELKNGRNNKIQK